MITTDKLNNQPDPIDGNARPYPPMDPAWKTKWVEALRSGKYGQTKSALWRTKNGDTDEPVGHCCLGVLCDVYNPTQWIPSTSGEWPDTAIYQGPGNDRSGGYLPDSLRRRTGIHAVAEIALTELNDAGADFPEIADWIDENL